MPEDRAYLAQPVFSSESADTAATAVPRKAANRNGTYGPAWTIIEYMGTATSIASNTVHPQTISL